MSSSTNPSPPIRRGHLVPGLLRRKEAAEYCSVSVATWDRLNAAGLTPEPAHLGGAVGWNRRELSAWIDAGCPRRVEWTTQWKAIVAARRR
ncbi:helix-turn-helix transcriptional regulator [Limnoglobus roseus]|uniref:DNA-binding protein n=1 Tax=Limnoglobus roseus TaxID=2598579 RepID=A0A5C1ABX4_9BACT|nr:hypothetical protein [Limnoglobus roseus]QEL16869.1 hypothetical protein PX52LOC_03843 [Limnoglobus roseus]